MKIKNQLKLAIGNVIYNCRVIGNGKKSIIAFHGFGQSGDAFLSLALSNPQCTIYAIDLPFHGKTTLDSPSDCLSVEQIEQLVQKLIDATGISRFSLVGFSIGAKLVFPIIETHTLIIDNVWLLAPDGITINFWYKTLTGTKLSRSIFHWMLARPKLIQKLGKVLVSSRLVENKKISFALKSLSTAGKREKVYLTWKYLRLLSPDISKLVRILNETNVPVNFIFGEKDRIITKATMYPLSSRIKNTELIMLPCGHENLIQYFSNSYAELLR